MQILHKIYNADKSQCTVVAPIPMSDRFSAHCLVKSNGDQWAVMSYLPFNTEAEALEQAHEWAKLLWVPTHLEPVK